MANRKNPATSLEAYRSLEPEKIAKMYLRIVEALTAIGPSTYEGIATYLNEKPERVWKRMSECLSLNLVHRTGERKIMKSGRAGFVWAAGPSPEPVKKKQRVLKGPSVQDFSKAINQVKQSLKTQEELF
jgi:predicted transcriptional regulator